MSVTNLILHRRGIALNLGPTASLHPRELALAQFWLHRVGLHHWLVGARPVFGDDLQDLLFRNFGTELGQLLKVRVLLEGFDLLWGLIDLLLWYYLFLKLA